MSDPSIDAASAPRSDVFDDAVAALSRRLPQRETLLLCVDFDGTLAPIVDDPDAAAILPEARTALAELDSHPNVTVAVVSGRDLDDVRSRVGVPGLVYAGNHGLELRAEGVTEVHPVAEEYRPDVDRVCARLRDAFADEAGVAVEHKGQTLTVHHSHGPAAHVSRVRTAVARAVGEVASGTLTVRGNDDIVEVRPAVDWGKGSVVASLYEGRTSCLPVFASDTWTDEAGFRAVAGDGVGIRVGVVDEEATAASEFVRRPSETAALLAWLSRAGVDRLGGAVETTPRQSTTGAADGGYTRPG